MIWHCTSTRGIHSSMIGRSDCPFCKGDLKEIGQVSPDGGLDVIQDRIKADHIRSFVGALILEGHCGGIFVTTSDFQRGSYVAADKASVMGLPVSLITGKQFDEALRLTNKASFNGYNLDEPPFSDTKVFTVCYRPERCSGKYTYVWGSDTRTKRNGEENSSF